MDVSDLVRTNPVLAVQTMLPAGGMSSGFGWANGPVLDDVVRDLLGRGHGLPPSVIAAWRDTGLVSSDVAGRASARWSPGVLGLAVGIDVACVVPLAVMERESWEIKNDHLPLAPARLVRLLAELLRHARRLTPGVVPEARAFSIDSGFSRPCLGSSMDVAGVLAIVRHVAGEHPSMARLCAVVEPDGPDLKPVEAIEEKLDAFVRECGTGTLLVRHPECVAAKRHDRDFEEVWEVASVADLADRLISAGLLDGWMTPRPVTVGAVHGLLGQLRELGGDHRRVVDLAERVLAADWDGSVPAALKSKPYTFLVRSLRHLGRYQAAYEKANAWRSDLGTLGDASCCEELANAALELAACLFDMVRFEDMLEVLGSLLDEIEAEPRRYTPDLRVKVWNTAARAMVQLGVDGWEQLFLRSLELQRITDPSNLARTRNYLIEGLLRAHRLEDAERMIRIALDSSTDPVSRAMLAFHRAELARRRSQVWSDEAAEAARPSRTRGNHALGFYLQATARQPGRTAADAVDRFRRAADCFEMDAAETEEANALWVLAHGARLAAAMHAGESRNPAAVALGRALEQPGLQVLRSRIGQLPEDVGSFERMMACLPWV